MRPPIPLDVLPSGSYARVVDVAGELDMVGRLGEMGISPGVHLQVLRGGNPCILAIGDQRFSFRGDRSALVLVESL
jgi:Fe2+ transport system protein FeoA